MVIALPLDRIRNASRQSPGDSIQVAHDEGPVVGAVYGRDSGATAALPQGLSVLCVYATLFPR